MVFWTGPGHRVVRTKAQYARIKRGWKRWYERCGWTVRGEIAYGPNEERHSIGLRVIDVERVRDIKGV